MDKDPKAVELDSSNKNDKSKKSHKDLIIILSLYVLVIILFILFVIGLKDKKERIIKNNSQESNYNTNIEREELK